MQQHKGEHTDLHRSTRNQIREYSCGPAIRTFYLPGGYFANSFSTAVFTCSTSFICWSLSFSVAIPRQTSFPCAASIKVNHQLPLVNHCGVGRSRYGSPHQEALVEGLNSPRAVVEVGIGDGHVGVDRTIHGNVQVWILRHLFESALG